MKDSTPDLLVIGAGSAGFSAAITAAEAGATVVIAGNGTIGGTCVNVGCVPSKTLIRAMESIQISKDASRFDGVNGTARMVDWQALIRQKQQLVDRLRKAKYEDLLLLYPNISFIPGQAQFTGNTSTELVVAGKVYRPKKVIITTGSSSALPPINGIQSIPVLDSTQALELESLPQSLLVIGGGVIGCELGQMFCRAGVKVTICCRSRLLPASDPLVSTVLADQFREEGITVCEGVGYQEIKMEGNLIKLVCRTAEGDQVIETESVLAASGRKPNVRALHLEKAGIEVNAVGGVKVDLYMQTTNAEVYAAGDVTGSDMFVYMAAYGAKLAARNALNGNTEIYSNDSMPSVVFTDPQFATVGLTESQATANGLAVETSTVSLDNVPRFITSRKSRGFIKLIAESSTKRILGATILAPEAGESIQTIVMALKAGLTTTELGDTLFPYLTAVEGLKLAAQGFSRDVSKLSCCAG
ncbi:MAG: mercury(II) reductase [Gammaproteobacteria bacterium]|jgi:mercuric reductase